ncbi:hypothetical protein F2P45_23020 [Massilia sp. CCM 8733]|uniref:Zn-dependent protease n=1 Tax=Massilia mucilaginosa TaxID=2609282 RepID=A0ABX0NXZ4_9BURK|nr:hypothetical protein [Massilia mucilaginosa]NHZ91854.1 hypothetical protein [Massilia mucilaginosa]
MTAMRLRLHAAWLVLALLCAWQITLSLAFFLQLPLAGLPRIALGALARSALPVVALGGLLAWIAVHELAHAGAAHWCGVRDGRIRWSSLLPAFHAPAQASLERSDTRFLIHSAGPLLDMLCSLCLAIAASLAPPAPAATLQGLFVVSLLIGLPNCCMLTRADMEQGIRQFRLLCGWRWPAALYAAVSLVYAGVVLLMAAKLLLHSRPGIV